MGTECDFKIEIIELTLSLDKKIVSTLILPPKTNEQTNKQQQHGILYRPWIESRHWHSKN